MKQDQQLLRKQRGYDISNRYKIKKQGKHWFVPSASGKGKYKINLVRQTCSCPDFETRKLKCKHLYATEYNLDRLYLDAIDGKVPDEVKEKPKKKTYTQPNWRAYHNSQVSEKTQFQYLLHQLCKGIKTPSQKTGRPKTQFADLIYAMAYKVYCCFSSRRFMSDLHEVFGKEYLSTVPHYNTVINGFAKGEIPHLLQQLIELSAMPLASVEQDFAVDSTGISTCRFFRWHHAKYGDKRLIDKRDWVKLHVCSGVKTNIITAVNITDRYAGDSPQFTSLVEKTALRFNIRELSGDKAYLSEKNMQTVWDKGGMPYIDFKSNSGLNSWSTGQMWRNMYHYYSLNQETFYEHYHKRSNVETTFMMIKTKFGDSLRSKTQDAMLSETLCKVLCHNICVLITSMHELGLRPKFWDEL